ncbi:MAG: purine-nucleoside phosphorylase [Planctomycetota bacterium]|nr:MAG: purine-nucleoside phosphorylase [Planctomycetota bacterium]
MNLSEAQRVRALADALRSRLGPPPEIAAILGSGWAAAGRMEPAEALPLSELPGWPVPRVPGHAPVLQVGRLAGRRVAVCGGRVHAYEGRSAAEIVRGVRALAAWGARSLLLLNAAGSLRPELAPGSCMPFTDHINLGLPNPLSAGQSMDGHAHFLDLVDLYDPEWRARLLAARPELRAGVYAGVPGPSYETPAEVGLLRALGVDAVGMSTIPEALAARDAGARVLAVSLLTNYAAGISGSRPSHGEVLRAAVEHGAGAAEVLRAAAGTAP